jgi:hypothetical protein
MAQRQRRFERSRPTHAASDHGTLLLQAVPCQDVPSAQPAVAHRGGLIRQSRWARPQDSRARDTAGPERSAPRVAAGPTRVSAHDCAGGGITRAPPHRWRGRAAPVHRSPPTRRGCAASRRVAARRPSPAPPPTGGWPSCWQADRRSCRDPQSGRGRACSPFALLGRPHPGYVLRTATVSANAASVASGS